MAGVFVELIVSWIILYLIERKSILSLGLLPVLKSLRQFVFGFMVTALLCMGVQTLEMFLKSSKWFLNENYSLTLVLKMFRWDFISVLTEELIFRGALLYVLISRFGAKKGIFVSAVAFGIYHWFSFGIFGNIIPMFFVFIGTGLMGYAWALAFSKTNSIFLPLGLHLGWNFTFNTIFSNGPLGKGLIISKGGYIISDWYSLIGLWVVPLIIFLIVKYMVPSEYSKETEIEIKTTATIV
jgi:uncharacterized protein